MANTPIRQINKSGEVSIPPDCKEHAGLTAGDYVQFEKLEDGKLLIKKWLPAIVALGLIAVFFTGSNGFGQQQLAYAQQPVTTNTTKTSTAVNGNTTSTTTTTTPSSSSSASNVIETLPLAANGAQLPFRVEFTYPSGVQDKWNVTRLSPNTVYGVQELVGQGGIVTKTFSTNTIDTFTIRFGQKYPVPIDQIAIVTVYSNNTQIIPGWRFPIHGTEFERQITFVTSVAPHMPTPEEVNGPVLKKIDDLTTAQRESKEQLSQVNIAVGLLTGWVSGGFGLHVVSAVLGFAGAMTLFAAKRRYDTYFGRPMAQRKPKTDQQQQQGPNPRSGDST